MASFLDSIFSADVQFDLKKAFNNALVSLTVKHDHMIAENSFDCTKQKIEDIVRSAGFCPLISPNKIDFNFVFTVFPYKLPDFFNVMEPQDPHGAEPHSPIQDAGTFDTDENVNLYFTVDEITELLKSQIFVAGKDEQVKDRWSPVNAFRSMVTPALSKGVREIVTKYQKPDYLAIEIGSGIGYALEGVPDVIRTQPCRDECKLLTEAGSTPVFNLDIQGIHTRLSKCGKKVPLFFALDVFDTLPAGLRRDSFLQLSKTSKCR